MRLTRRYDDEDAVLLLRPHAASTLGVGRPAIFVADPRGCDYAFPRRAPPCAPAPDGCAGAASEVRDVLLLAAAAGDTYHHRGVLLLLLLTQLPSWNRSACNMFRC